MRNEFEAINIGRYKICGLTSLNIFFQKTNLASRFNTGGNLANSSSAFHNTSFATQVEHHITAILTS